MLMSNRIFLKLLFCFCLIALSSGFHLDGLAQMTDENKHAWYCDERLQLNLRVGTVLEIIPYQKKSNDPVLANFTYEDVKYKTVNIIKFKTVDLFTGEMKLQEEVFYNVQTAKNKAFKFIIGQKYLFETNLLDTEQQAKDSEKFAFIKPQGFLKTFDEAKKDIDFLIGAKDLNVYQEILKTDDSDIVSAENIGVKATSLIKPFSKDLKKSRIRNKVNVFVVVDETGRVIKAKSFCAKTTFLAEAAEQAALLSRFAPVVKDGKPIKVKGIITYNFKP
jgi:Gram-negative bacterial TonB protein C-terminal